MASNKTGMTNLGKGSAAELAGALLAVLAGGLTAGAILVTGAKALGEKITEIQKKDYERLEKQREADREAVRKIMENETE